ncbi:hypothetical protein [Neptunomonas concharum]|uniref:Uncharacterized protein n=1 Tax=Neptunomonas concharum TaxID=1031538 RepID=A0A5P1RBZ1_9GAMM|nr:hypothetical protein [Neptunomonas concharum]QEQ96802.1 hypothetical protein F0U83_08765 [Neptunomonas concharum]
MLDFKRKFFVASGCILFIVFARLDMGRSGTVLIAIAIAALIFLELFFIRKTLFDVYADALTEHKVVMFFLKHRVINAVLSAIVASWLALYLLIHVNLAAPANLGFFVLLGILLMVLLPSADKLAKSVVKEKPSIAFSRIGLVFIAVLMTVLLDGASNAFLPIDSRIKEAFDEDIPLYVIDDVKHSFLYLQHFLRTLAFLNYNVQSIGLSDQVGSWFQVVKFLLLLSPTPYVAFSLLYLSLSSIGKRRVVAEP